MGTLTRRTKTSAGDRTCRGQVRALVAGIGADDADQKGGAIGYRARRRQSRCNKRRHPSVGAPLLLQAARQKHAPPPDATTLARLAVRRAASAKTAMDTQASASTDTPHPLSD